MPFLLFLSCSKEGLSDQLLFEKAKYEYNESLFDTSIITLNRLIMEYPSSKYSPESMYLLHKIYLNEFEEYDLSIIFLNDIIDKFPKHDLSKKALFTKGYIYSNHLSSYSDAFLAYNKFISLYPNDELVPSAEYEIDGLKEFILDVEKILNKK